VVAQALDEEDRVAEDFMQLQQALLLLGGELVGRTALIGLCQLGCE